MHCLVKMRNFLYIHKHAKNFTKEELEYWYDHLGSYIMRFVASVICSLLFGRSLH